MQESKLKEFEWKSKLPAPAPRVCVSVCKQNTLSPMFLLLKTIKNYYKYINYISD